MKEQPTVLLVDDDPAMLALVESWLAQDGFRVLTASSGSEALEVFSEGDPDLVISDLIMPGMNGIELLKQLRASSSELPIILVTSYGSIPSAVEAIREGADDYLSKPIHPDDLKIVIARALEQRALRREVSRLRSEVDERFSFEHIVARSKSMRKLLVLAKRLAERDVTVLIQGETGNGKDLLARAIHQTSSRQNQPFVTVDCGALADNLLESELFGHVRGAFSGAVRTRRGLFVEADSGSLFLDEIGNMSGNLQSKLLRVLQDREIKAVGADASQKVDVRIIAASNADLESQVESGSFRHDLFYRLAVVTLQIPPLRERPEDILPLCEHFIQAEAGTGPACQLEPAALERLMAYPWPGNVRELENAIRRGCLLCDGRRIGLAHLPSSLQGYSSERSLIEATLASRQKLERETVIAALEEAEGNRAKAARLLGISRSSLYNRLRQLEID